MALLKITELTLQKFGRESVDKMKSNARKYKASGNMEQGFRYQTDPLGMKIFAVDYVQYFEQGRGATKSQEASVPTLRERILEWIKVKPVAVWDGYTKESMAYVIARKIHRQGVSWHKKSERKIYSDVINRESITLLLKTLAKFQSAQATSEIERITKDITK
jgi:hypothetical protein